MRPSSHGAPRHMQNLADLVTDQARFDISIGFAEAKPRFSRSIYLHPTQEEPGRPCPSGGPAGAPTRAGGGRSLSRSGLRNAGGAPDGGHLPGTIAHRRGCHTHLTRSQCAHSPSSHDGWEQSPPSAIGFSVRCRQFRMIGASWLVQPIRMLAALNEAFQSKDPVRKYS